MRQPWLLTFVGILLGSCGSLSAAENHAANSDAEELLAIALAGQRASRELVSSISCRVIFNVKIKSKGDPSAVRTQQCEGDYWHSRDAIRLSMINDGDRVDYVWKNSIKLSTIERSIGGKDAVNASKTSSFYRYSHRGDAWARGLLVINVPENGHWVYPEDLISQATSLIKVEKTERNGSSMVLVRLAFAASAAQSEPWEVELLLDPSVNYLVRKVTYFAKNHVRYEEVTDFKSLGSGVVFPQKIIGRSGTERDMNSTESEAVISNIQISRVSNSVFEKRFPSGIYLADQTTNTKYKVDSTGKSISSATPLTKYAPPSPLSKIPFEPGMETVEEPRSLSRFIMPISISLLVVGLALYSLRRYRRANQ